MGTHRTVQEIPALLKSLKQHALPEGGVISAYVDTSADRVRRGGHLLFLRDAFIELRDEIPESELEAFNATAVKVENHLQEIGMNSPTGLAIYAGPEAGYLFSVRLPRTPREDVVWSRKPQLAPLEAIVDDFERFAVAIFDTEKARLFTIYLGDIEEQVEIQDYVPGKHKSGDWFALSQSRYARHRDEHVRRHADRVVGRLMAMLRSCPFDRLLLAGPDEALVVLRQQLNRPLRTRLAGSVSLEMFASNADVLRVTVEAAAAVERRNELAAIDDLLDLAGTRHVTLGISKTLDALNAGSVHRLFIVEGLEAAGAECARCHRIAEHPGACPICGEELSPLARLGESAVARAREERSQVEFVSGVAAERLGAHGGLGAFTRY